MYQIIHYLDGNENDIYQAWLDSLRDRVAKIAVIRRVARMELGQFGDQKPLRDGISELKIDVGAGYRVYYAHLGNMVILLTCGGCELSASWSHFVSGIKAPVDCRRNSATLFPA